MEQKSRRPGEGEKESVQAGKKIGKGGRLGQVQTYQGDDSGYGKKGEAKNTGTKTNGSGRGRG